MADPMPSTDKLVERIRKIEIRRWHYEWSWRRKTYEITTPMTQRRAVIVDSVRAAAQGEPR